VNEPGPAPIRFAPEVLAAIREAAACAYPHEGCGALLGPSEHEIRGALSLPNEEEGSPRTRFRVSPRDYIAVEEAAEARNERLVGFWHSHPDHPARPSPTDRRYAWEGLLTVVVRVEKGEPREITAWEVPGPEQPFRERRIAVNPGRTDPKEASCPSS
jgi:proteasome lid subunit RPN8/RPN11